MMKKSVDELLQVDHRHSVMPRISHGFVEGMRPLVIARAEGSYVFDSEGKKYLDFESQYDSVRVGYGNEEILSYMNESLRDLQLVTCKFVHRYRVELEELLASILPGNLKRFWFGTNGTDANFSAIRIARNWSGKYQLVGCPTYGVVRRSDAHHGVVDVPYPTCHRCPYGLKYPACGMVCFEVLKATVETLVSDQDLGAIITEPMSSGVAGFSPSPPEFLSRVRELCDRHGLLLIYDEIRTNFGITGKMFAFEHYGVEPDILCLGKGITSGYAPLSAVVVSDKVIPEADEAKSGLGFGQWAEIHTYTGYPLGCAAAIANIRIILREKLWENAARLGAHIQNEIKSLGKEVAIVGPVHASGMYIHFDIVKPGSDDLYPKAASLVAKKCVERGLLVAGEHGTIRLKPHIDITAKEAEDALEILLQALREVGRESV